MHVTWMRAMQLWAGYRSGRTCASVMFRGGTISGRRIASHRLHVQRAPIAQITRIIDYLCISPLAGPAIVPVARFLPSAKRGMRINLGNFHFFPNIISFSFETDRNRVERTKEEGRLVKTRCAVNTAIRGRS